MRLLRNKLDKKAPTQMTGLGAVLLLSVWILPGQGFGSVTPDGRLLQRIAYCLEAVSDPSDVRAQLGAVTDGVVVSGRLKPVDGWPIFFEGGRQDGVEVNICRSVDPYPMDGSDHIERILPWIAEEADRSGLIPLQLTSQGQYFADCHNMPDAQFGLSVQWDESGLRFQAVRSPAVGAPCNHSYGLQSIQ